MILARRELRHGYVSVLDVRRPTLGRHARHARARRRCEDPTCGGGYQKYKCVVYMVTKASERDKNRGDNKRVPPKTKAQKVTGIPLWAQPRL